MEPREKMQRGKRREAQAQMIKWLTGTERGRENERGERIDVRYE